MTVRASVAPPSHEGTPLTVSSFTTIGKDYSVDPELKTCTCRRFEIRRDCEKHVALAEALVKMRARRDLLPIEDELATERLFGLAKRIYAPVLKRTVRYPDVVDAYDLSLEIAGYRYATERLVEAARARHRKVLAEYVGRAA